MTVETMDGKATSTAEHPPVIVVEQPEGKSVKSRVTRKHVIIGVTCALVVAMVITGVLLGVRFYLDSANELVTRTLEFRKDKDHKVKEDVGADVKENYVRYHLKDDDSEVWVINDFNRELQVVKVKQSEGSKCYVATLNSSADALPEAVLSATATDDEVETEDENYDVSETAIRDHSMLGAHGEKLCNNLDVHWMVKTCGSPKDETADEDGDENGREKRAVRVVRWRCKRTFCYFRLYRVRRHGRNYYRYRKVCYKYNGWCIKRIRFTTSTTTTTTTTTTTEPFVRRRA